MQAPVTRQAILDDLEAVVPLFDAYRQFYKQASDLQAASVFLRDKFNHGESVIFLAWEGPKAVGFTQLFPSFSSPFLDLRSKSACRAPPRGQN